MGVLTSEERWQGWDVVVEMDVQGKHQHQDQEWGNGRIMLLKFMGAYEVSGAVPNHLDVLFHSALTVL